ncbi:MAG: hypothetical protein MZV70_24810 [Desulfobacterales bacterium]|nr:hypothetical protein [Desulfobacterales bacterium]
MMPMNIDIEPLKRFEDGLDPEHPERSAVPAKILGYGEISTIFEIDAESTKGIACKRMAIFRTEQEVSEYENIYNSYNALLEKEIRIGVPDYGFAWFFSAKGNIVAFDIQAKLAPESIANRALHLMDTENVRRIVPAHYPRAGEGLGVQPPQSGPCDRYRRADIELVIGRV